MDTPQTTTSPRHTLLDELGLVDLPAEKRDELLVKMTESLLARIAVEVTEKLSDADKEVFASLQENANADEITAFLKEKIPDYEAFLEKITADFRADMKNAVDTLS